jgi:acyl carrier protein
MDIEREVRDFVVKNFLYGDKTIQLKEDASFIEMGIMDSTGVLEVVNYIESKFGITLADDELTPDNLDSIFKIVSFIRRKTLSNV